MKHTKAQPRFDLDLKFGQQNENDFLTAIAKFPVYIILMLNIMLSVYIKPTEKIMSGF